MCNIGLSPYLEKLYLDIIVIILSFVSLQLGFRIINLSKLFIKIKKKKNSNL